MRSEFLTIMRKGAIGRVTGRVRLVDGRTVKIAVKLDRPVDATNGEQLAQHLATKGEGKYSYTEFEEGEGKASNTGTAVGDQLAYAVRAAFGRVRDRELPDDADAEGEEGEHLSPADRATLITRESDRIAKAFVSTPYSDTSRVGELRELFRAAVATEQPDSADGIRTIANATLEAFVGG